MDASEYPIVAAHRHSSGHRDELLDSELCGCFYCRRTYRPTDIIEWVDEVDCIGTTAICPYCGIDSVLGSGSGYPITDEFLLAMNSHWF